MESFKLDHFKRAYPERTFPWFRTLSACETQVIRQTFTRKVGPREDAASLVLTNRLLELSVPYKGINAENEHFDLAAVAKDLGISAEKKVYVNWYRYDNVDEIQFVDLTKYFDDIWYPGPDDIDIFDATFSWILSISHDGAVRSARLK